MLLNIILQIIITMDQTYIRYYVTWMLLFKNERLFFRWQADMEKRMKRKRLVTTCFS